MMARATEGPAVPPRRGPGQTRGLAEAEGLRIWRLLAAGAPAPADFETAALAAFARRLTHLVGPALAAHVLAPVAAGGAVPGLEAEALSENRLANRFRRGRQLASLRSLAAAGIEVAVIKGLATAHQLYAEPEARVAGDLDVVVRAADRDRLVAHMLDQGCRFRPAVRTQPWGWISAASYVPLITPDRLVELDIHVEPDCYPLYRALTAEALFAAAEPLEADGTMLRVPTPTHALLLMASNAAKDKFGARAVKAMLDAQRLLAARRPVDWAEARALARRGRFAKPFRAFLALAAALGAPAAAVPADLAAPPGGLAGAEFRRALRAWVTLFPGPGSGRLALLRRELLLSAEPRVAAVNNWLRVSGLVRPRSGLPPPPAERPASRGEGR